MTKEQIQEQNRQRAMQWMEDQAASGLGKQEWCKRNGISRSLFFKWQKILKNCSEAIDTGSVFIEIPIAKPQEPRDLSLTKSNPISVSISYGDFNIDVRNGVEEALLCTVLKAVRNVN